MSDTRTDREELAAVIEPRAWLDSSIYGIYKSLRTESLATADRILAAGFSRHTENTFTLNASPEEIHRAVDVLRDLDVTDGDWEYGDHEATHVSGFRFVSDPRHMPVELRPDIGEDRVDA
jgi:hypothetical protein